MRIRQAGLFAVLVAIAAGCGQSSAPSTTEKPTPAETPGPKPDTQPTYTIKVREKQAGEKYEVIDTVWVDVVKEAKGEPKVVKTNTGKTTYTEEVQAVANGKVSKTKRAYGVANSLYAGEPLTLSYSEKTVVIERIDEKQIKFALADGGSVGIDGPFLSSEFERPHDRSAESLLPTAAVKVGEEWQLSKDNLVAYFGQFAAPWKGTGKLTRVYTKDGKQYGTILIVAAMPGFRDEPPRETHEWTYDGCIDGSTTDSTRKHLTTTRVPDINGKAGATTDLKYALETTFKTVK